MNFTVEQQQMRVPAARGRPVYFNWLVLRDGEPYAAFKGESAADAYARRLNALNSRQQVKA